MTKTGTTDTEWLERVQSLAAIGSEPERLVPTE